MCLEVKGTPEVLIAKRNIICFKELNGNISRHYYFLYQKGIINPIIEIKLHKRYLGFVVYEGYHSKIKDICFYKIQRNNAIMYIPTGTRYIIGGENDINVTDNYVSETIVYYGKNTWWNRLKFKMTK